MTEIETTGGRRRGRDRQNAAGRSKLPEQKPFAQPRMTYGPTKVLSEDEVEAIHLASLKVLQDHGIDFLDADDGLELLRPHQPDVRVPVAKKLDALSALVDELKGQGRAFVRLDEASDRIFP